MTSSEPTLSFWHGAQRWSGQPELRPARPKSYECGPGLYLTNQLATARKYAKGGGQTVLVTLAADLVLLEDVRLPLNTLLEGLESLPRVRGRKEIANRLKEAAHRFEDQTLPAAYLLNNCIYNDALGGETGPALARWFTEQGIDASRYDKLGGEDWLVIFNLAKVKKTRIMTSNQAYELGSFPTLPEQRLAGAEPAAAEEPPAPRSLRMR